MTEHGPETAGWAQRRNETAVVVARCGDDLVDAVDNLGDNSWQQGGASASGVSGPPRSGIDVAFAQETESGAQQTDPDPERSGGHDLAHAALRAVRERARSRGTEPGARPPRARYPGKQNTRRRQWSGPRGDERDPQSFGVVAARMSTRFGWGERLASGRVFGQWAQLVGDEIAEHARPISLADGELTVRASSTAWATQLRLLQRQLLATIASGVGDGVVRRMRIHGPTAPHWRQRGRYSSGGGPQDTHG